MNSGVILSWEDDELFPVATFETLSNGLVGKVVKALLVAKSIDMSIAGLNMIIDWFDRVDDVPHLLGFGA
jgi:hypothetical protein